MLLLNIIFLVLIIFLVWLIRHYYLLIRCKQSGSIIEEKEFQSGLHKAQVIDLREKKDFDAGHILGARNLPYSMLRQRYKELRSDLPIYLYDETKVLSMHAAIFLHKKGYPKENIFILKTGYSQWDGKVKSKNA